MPTMPELTDFPGKIRHFNIGAEIGAKFYAVGLALLDNTILLSSIMSKHGGNTEQMCMDILICWLQGRGIADCTWRGLLGVLNEHCPDLARDIEETLKAEMNLINGADLEKGMLAFCYINPYRVLYR